MLLDGDGERSQTICQNLRSLSKREPAVEQSSSHDASHSCDSGVLASSWCRPGGPLQTTQDGNKYMLTACCYFTKWVEAIAIKDKTANTVASELFKLQCQKGAASIFIHDQGTEFVNKVNDKMCQLMGIQKRISTAYHPQTNGLDERWNQTLQTALRKVIDPTTQDDWDTHLDPIMAAHRASKHESTGMSPYFMVYHKEPLLPVDVQNRVNGDIQEDSKPVFHDTDVFTRYARAMIGVKEQIADTASQNIEKAQDRQKKNFDKRHLIPHFEIGTEILLKNLTRNGRMGGKMDSHYTGPYTIVDDLGHGVYRLKNSKNNKVLAKTHNACRFKTYHRDDKTPDSDIEPSADISPPPKRTKYDIEVPEADQQASPETNDVTSSPIPDIATTKNDIPAVDSIDVTAVCEGWQREMCSRLKLNFVRGNGRRHVTDMSTLPTNKPLRTSRIKGDGNCLLEHLAKF